MIQILFSKFLVTKKKLKKKKYFLQMSKTRKSYIKTKRKFKTLCSIPKDCIEYNNLKCYIELENILISHDLRKDQEILFNEIVSYLQKNDDKNNFQYLTRLLVYFINIRRKERELICKIILKLIRNFQNEQDLITDTIKDYLYTSKILVGDAIYSKRIIKMYEPKEFRERKETCFSLYKEGSLEYILKEDDIEGLKVYINTHNKFNAKTNRLCVRKKSLLTVNSRDEGLCTIELLDFCSYYGSVKCFKFLKANGSEYGNKIIKMSISGGNIEIIHEIEQDGISFDNCFKISVKFHHQIITDWLLSNFKCEIIPLVKTLQYLDYQTFLFLLFNDYVINKADISPFGYLVDQKSFDVIKLLIDKGFNINKSTGHYCFKDKTPLEIACSNVEIDLEIIHFFIDNGANPKKDESLVRLCRHSKLNFEAIQLLLDNGADINTDDGEPLAAVCSREKVTTDEIRFFIEKGANPKKGESLKNLCGHSKLNFEAIQLLLDNGADINGDYGSPLFHACFREEVTADEILFFIEKGADVNIGYNTLLCYLCQFKKTLNLEFVQILLDNGADINKGYGSSPLIYLCKQDEINFEAIKFFIENGADVNKSRHDHHDCTITPLSEICKNEEVNIEVIKYLLDHGANPKIRFLDRYGKPFTPVEYFIIHHNIELVELFLDRGADTNIMLRDRWGKSYKPLEYFAKNEAFDSFKIMKLLYQRGIDINIEFQAYNEKTYTPLKYFNEAKKWNEFLQGCYIKSPPKDEFHKNDYKMILEDGVIIDEIIQILIEKGAINSDE